VNNVVHELESYVQVFESEDSTARMRIKATRKIKRCIIPAVAKVSKVLNEAGNSVAPTGTVRVICNRWEQKMKNDVVDADNKWKSVDFQLLESYTNTVKPTIATVAPRQVKRRKADPTIPTLPSPSNGIQYTKVEVMDILSINSKLQWPIINHMITSNLVPCGKDTIYRMLKDKKNGKAILDTDWSGRGKPKIVDDSTMADIIVDLHNETGRTFGKEDVNKLILKHCNEKLTKAGHIPLNLDERLKPSTLRNYTTEIAMNHSMSLTQTSIAKTSTRYAAECSFRGSISYLFVIAVTHFIHAFEEECDIRKELKGVSKETRQLYDLITDSRGGIPVYVVGPELITSTDDSTVYIFEGHSPKTDVFRLVTKESCATKGTNSVYNIDDSNAMCGMRVKITWTFSGGGTCAPLFITVSGLNEREMPPGKDLIVLKIPGLCIGGSGVGSNAQHGYVVFLR
jgi:hypothetical protein